METAQHPRTGARPATMLLAALLLAVTGLFVSTPAQASDPADFHWRPADTGRTHNAYFYVDVYSSTPGYCNAPNNRVKARVKINYKRSGNRLWVNYVEIKNTNPYSSSRVRLGHDIVGNSAGVYSRGWGINELIYSQSDRINRDYYGYDYSSYETIRSDRSYLTFLIADGNHWMCSANFNLFIYR